MNDPLIGQQLDEYRIEALLGRGGMARVYRSLDVRLKRYAAIKIINITFRDDADYIKRFEQEAQAIAKLEHPNIVRLYRYGEANELLYMAMQYVEGLDLNTALSDYQKRGEFMEPEDIRKCIRQVCQALDYAHAKGVIHRDVKPSNIILDKQGDAFLADFGLALLTDEGTRGQVFGSPHYIAPEQAISSAKTVPQSDLYSAGIILYEMLTNSVPFNAPTSLEVALQHVSEPPPPLRGLRPAVSPQIEAVVLRALAKEPEERYPSGAQLVEALDRAFQVAPLQTATRPFGAPHTTMSDLVELSLKQRPLPPIPAAVATWSPIRRPEPTPAPGPTRAIPPTLPPARKPWLALAIGSSLILAMILCVLVSMLVSRSGVLGLAQASTTRLASVTATLPISPTLAVTGTIKPASTMTPARAAASPTATAASPSATPPPGITPAPGAATGAWEIVLTKRKDESLFIVNQSKGEFPLGPLSLRGANNEIQGARWGVETLKTGECVTAWKNMGKPEAPKVSCQQVGQRLTLEGPDIVWKTTFKVYYAGNLVGTCEEKSDGCRISIK